MICPVCEGRFLALVDNRCPECQGKPLKPSAVAPRKRNGVAARGSAKVKGLKFELTRKVKEKHER